MNIKSLILALAVLGLSAGFVFANEGMKHDEGMEAIDHEKGVMMDNQYTSETKAVEVGNKICPVTGNPVDDGSMGELIKHEYNGKIYNLCCKMCVKDFKKNPEKYSKIAEEEVTKSGMTEKESGKEDHSGHDHK